MDINTMVDSIRSAKSYEDAKRLLEKYLDDEYNYGYNIGYDDGYDDGKLYMERECGW